MVQTQFPQEQFWKLYEKLPQELKDALWAEGTGDTIYEVCQRYEVTDSMQDVVRLVGQVLIGLLLPQDFQKELQALGIKKLAAEKVAHEINRFIFYPVKPALEQLHKMEIEVSAKVVTPEPPVAPEGAEEPKTTPNKDDTYREPIE